MKKILLLAAMAAFFQSCTPKEETKTETVTEMKEIPELRHVVLFKFKDTSTETDVKGIIEAFQNLPKDIPQIKGFEWGLNNSPENLNDSLTHCFTLTFHSEEDRAVYLPHPAHKAFGAMLGPHLDKVLVVDYWAGE